MLSFPILATASLSVKGAGGQACVDSEPGKARWPARRKKNRVRLGSGWSGWAPRSLTASLCRRSLSPMRARIKVSKSEHEVPVHHRRPRRSTTAIAGGQQHPPEVRSAANPAGPAGTCPIAALAPCHLPGGLRFFAGASWAPPSALFAQTKGGTLELWQRAASVDGCCAIGAAQPAANVRAPTESPISPSGERRSREAAVCLREGDLSEANRKSRRARKDRGPNVQHERAPSPLDKCASGCFRSQNARHGNGCAIPDRVGNSVTQVTRGAADRRQCLAFRGLICRPAKHALERVSVPMAPA
jgi:hypothetical protein